MSPRTGPTRRAGRAAWRAAVLSCALALLAAACSGGDARKRQSPQALAAARAKADLRLQQDHESAIVRNLARVKAEHDDFAAGRVAAPPVVDVLIVSGGGDWGAFGAGFLKGWGTVPPGAMARPVFDVVTGVSTGALIAPFAFLGDEASIDQVVHLYRNPKKNWVKRRSLFSLFGAQSFAEIPGLERELSKALDLPVLQRIVDAGSGGRLLLVSTTNIDTEEMQVWDIVEQARSAVNDGTSHRVRQVLLASSALPGVFPPREIDGVLYVDGGVTGNILYGGRGARRDEDSFVARWRQRYPDAQVPRIRYWVIFNNEVRWPPETVQPRWSSVLMKSSTASTRAATLNSMRQLFLLANLARLKHEADVEVRFVAVPDGWTPPSPSAFDRKTMNALADLGEAMGKDPDSWRTEAP